MSIKDQSLSPQDAIRQADEALLAALGYKQEFKREFAPIEVCWSSNWSPVSYLFAP